MAIFITDAHKGEKIKQNEVVASIEYAENPFITGGGLCIAHKHDTWFLFSYDTKNFEDNHPFEYGSETYIWAMYFRHAQQILNNYKRAKEKAENENVDRKEKL